MSGLAKILINNSTVGRVVISLNRLLGLEIAMIGLTVTEKDLEGLPKELLSQLKMTTSQPQKTLQKDLEVIRKLGDYFDIDAFITQYYFEYKSVLKREVANSKLYRLCKKGVLLKHSRGCFSLTDKT